MRFLSLLLGALLMTAAAAAAQPTGEEERPAWRLVIHGGAGVIERARLTPEEDARDPRRARTGRSTPARRSWRAAAARSTRSRRRCACSRTIPISTPAAARSSPMTGGSRWTPRSWTARNRNAGAVTGVTATRNPISLARAGDGAQPARLPQPRGRRPILARAGPARRSRPNISRPPSAAASSRNCARGPSAEHFDVHLKYGTVGAVALDQEGHVAAATSTGGLTGKRWGRIGDSPIIGAGTYADDRGCAVSATGAGEYFIRVGVAHEICAQIRYRFRDAIREAQARCPTTPRAIRPYGPCQRDARWSAATCRRSPTGDRRGGGLGGSGGVIVVTPWGDGVTSFNTPGMYRGKASPARPLGRHLRRRSKWRSLRFGTIGGRAMLACRLSPASLPRPPAAPAACLVGIWP